MKQMKKPKKAKKAKRPQQRLVHALGVGVGVTFNWAEEDRVRKKAVKLGVSMDDLIVRAIDRAARRTSNVNREPHEVIDRAVKVLAAPQQRRTAR